MVMTNEKSSACSAVASSVAVSCNAMSVAVARPEARVRVPLLGLKSVAGMAAPAVDVVTPWPS